MKREAESGKRKKNCFKGKNTTEKRTGEKKKALGTIGEKIEETRVESKKQLPARQADQSWKKKKLSTTEEKKKSCGRVAKVIDKGGKKRQGKKCAGKGEENSTLSMNNE